MRVSRLAMAAAVVVAFGLLAPAGAANRNSGTSAPVVCGDNGFVTWTPTKLWPPNHKAHNINVTYTDPDGGTNTIELIATPHNEMVSDTEEFNGTGNTQPATDSSAPVAPKTGSASQGDDPAVVTITGTARSERSGHKNAAGGRVYKFEYIASNDEDNDGTSEDGCATSATPEDDAVVVFVPHDCRAGGCRG